MQWEMMQQNIDLIELLAALNEEDARYLSLGPTHSHFTEGRVQPRIAIFS